MSYYKIIKIKMINGVSLSEIETVKLSRMSHYRRVVSVQKGDFSRFSVQDSQMIKVLEQRRYNHDKWKNFHKTRFTTELSKDNDHYRKKLDRIKIGKSIYAINNYNSPRHSKANNFYSRKKNLLQIETTNPVIAKKIINAKGEFNNWRHQTQFSRYRDTVHRLQRFSVLQRMTSYSQRRIRVKTEGEELRNSLSPASPPPSPNRRLALFKKVKRFVPKQ